VQRKLGFSERRQLQFLAVTDEYTRECHTLIVGRSIKAVDVQDLLEVLFTEHGVPEHIRCESGPELIAQQLRAWLDRQAVKPLYIAPGAPWENGCAESFIDDSRTNSSTARCSRALWRPRSWPRTGA
jgi:transposase InsO family protein